MKDVRMYIETRVFCARGIKADRPFEGQLPARCEAAMDRHFVLKLDPSFLVDRNSLASAMTTQQLTINEQSTRTK